MALTVHRIQSGYMHFYILIMTAAIIFMLLAAFANPFIPSGTATDTILKPENDPAYATTEEIVDPAESFPLTKAEPGSDAAGIFESLEEIKK